MANKKFLWGMLAITLAFGMMVIAFDNDSGAGSGVPEVPDVWSVAERADVEGERWVGSYRRNFSEYTFDIKDVMEEEWSSEMDAMFGAIKFTTSVP